MTSSLPLFNDSLFEPKCIAEARMEWDPKHLDLLISYYKKKCDKEKDVIQAIEIYIKYCKEMFGVDVSMADVFEKILTIEPWTQKTCEVCRKMGLCKDPSECPIMEDALQRFLTDIDPDSVFYNPGEGLIEFMVNNTPVTIDINKLIKYVVKREKGSVDDYVVGNPNLLNKIYFKVYFDVPYNPFTEDDVFKLFEYLKKHAVWIRPISERQVIKNKFIDMLMDGTFNFYDYNLLQSGEVTTWGGLFLRDDKYLYIKSSVMEEAIEGYNIKKIIEALSLFIIQSSKQIRVNSRNGSRRYRFTVFDFEAIKKYIKKYEHIDFEPKVYDKDDLYETMDDVERFLRHQDPNESIIITNNNKENKDNEPELEQSLDESEPEPNEDRAKELYNKILEYLRDNGDSVKDYELEEWAQKEGYSQSELQHALRELMDDAEIHINKSTISIL